MKGFLELKSLDRRTSGAALLVLVVTATALYTLVLEPTLYQFLAFLVLDMAIMSLTSAVDERLYTRFYPESRAYLREFDFSVLDQMTREKKQKALRSMMEFPRQRANYLMVMSVLKLIPVLLFIVYGWERHGRTMAWQTVLTLSIAFQIFSFHYSAAYIEAHMYLSKKISELLKMSSDWAVIFRTIEIPDQKKELTQKLGLSIACLLLMTMFFMLSLVGSDSFESNQLIFFIFLAFGISFLMAAHLFYMYSGFFRQGLGSLFKAIKDIEHNRPPSLAINTSSALATIGKTFNKMAHRLEEKDREISVWVEEVSEKSRFQGIGEISSLLMHDLSSPIHVLKNLSSNLEEDPSSFKPQYSHHISKSVGRIDDLVSSIRARLKNSSTEASVSGIHESLCNTIDFLVVKYSKHGISRSTFLIDENLKDVRGYSCRGWTWYRSSRI